MKLGCTYDEKVLKSDNYKDIVSKAIKLGLGALEISPDKSIMTKEEYVEIVKFANSKGLDVNYHVPYFASDSYDIRKLKTKKDLVMAKYDEMFDLIEALQAENKRSAILVIHGEEFEADEDKSLKNTVEMIRHFIETIGNRELNIKLALETVKSGSKLKVGDNHKEILDILKRVDSSRLGICLDICHDSMGAFPNKSMFSEKFLKNILYVHAHGIDMSTNSSHISIVKSSVNFLDTIMFLKENKPDITLNIEILSDFTNETYLSDLFFDLHVLGRILY